MSHSSHPPVVSSCQQIDLRVSRQDPEPIVLPSEGLHPCSLAHVPHADALVLRVTDYQVLQKPARR